MNHKEYIIFCDESDAKGEFFSNFYGGVLIGSNDYDIVSDRLRQKKVDLNFYGEVKWSKVTERYLDKYLALIEAFFEEIEARRVRVRIMFQQNAQTRRGDGSSFEERYFKLYYQFLKHAFGFRHREGGITPCWLRIHFDELPHTREGASQFKGFILALQNDPWIRNAGFKIREEDIAEIRSHDHVLAQCLDIVLGSMSFRLNDKHKEKLPGERRRGKRTIAKEKLYKAIYTHIQRIRPRLNIGISTGLREGLTGKWQEPYLHWAFVPADVHHDSTKTKKGPRVT
jgi:hypothetical protein